MGGGSPVTSQTNYQFFEDDGTEATNTAIGAQNAALTRYVAANNNILLRVMPLNSGTAVTASTNWQLQAAFNAGSFFSITTTSSYAFAYDSSNLTNGGATTSRLTSSAGAFGPANGVSETGVTGSVGLAVSTYTDLLYTLTLVAADLPSGSALTFRTLIGGATLGSYDVTPALNTTTTPLAVYGVGGGGVVGFTALSVVNSSVSGVTGRTN